MDHSITFATPEIRQAQGAQAYDDGRSVDDHGLIDPADIRHFEFGWHQRRIECKQMRERQAVAASEDCPKCGAPFSRDECGCENTAISTGGSRAAGNQAQMAVAA